MIRPCPAPVVLGASTLLFSDVFLAFYSTCGSAGCQGTCNPGPTHMVPKICSRQRRLLGQQFSHDPRTSPSYERCATASVNVGAKLLGGGPGASGTRTGRTTLVEKDPPLDQFVVSNALFCQFVSMFSSPLVSLFFVGPSF